MDITIVGASSLLDKVTANDIRLTADLTGLEAGTQEVKLKVDLPNYIRIEDNTSPTIKVQITGGDSEAGTQLPEENNPEVDPPSGTETPSNGGTTEPEKEPDSGSGSGSTPSEPPTSTDPPTQNVPDKETPGTDEEPSDTPSEGSTDNSQGQNPPVQNEGTGTTPDESKPDSGTGTDTGGEAVTP